MSIYTYSKFPEKLKKLHEIDDDVVFYNVGWLDYHYDYQRGFVGDDFLNVFFQYVKNASNMFRGLHFCEFCMYEGLLNDEDYRPTDHRTTVDIGGETRALGSMEVYVFGNKCIYICPDMIIHYIKEHSYRPPAAFCEAVMPGVKLPEVVDPLFPYEQQNTDVAQSQRKSC